MPQLRKDPIIGRWIIISTERAKRPKDFAISHKDAGLMPCPFCEGHENMTPPEIFAFRKEGTGKDKPGWQVRVVPSKHLVLRIGRDLGRKAVGIYDVMNSIGAHEIIIENPKHITHFSDLEQDNINLVIKAYINRIIDLKKDKNFKYVMLFKNHGQASGASSITHTHSQLIATPVNPKRVKEELNGSRLYFEYKERCIYCDIIRQELDKRERIVAEVDGFVAFCPFASRFPFETWILPLAHSCDFENLREEQIPALSKILKEVFLRLRKVLDDPPYNYVLHTAPFRRAKAKAGYWRTITEDYHWHIEIMPRLTGIAGFEWGTGFYINPTPPEEAAKYLREAKI